MICKILIASATFLLVTFNTGLGSCTEYRESKRSAKISILHDINKNDIDYDKVFKWCRKRASKKISDKDLWKILSEARKTPNPLLICSIISAESTFNKNAKSSEGARGLMQVMPLWIPELRKKKIGINHKNDLFDIRKNIIAGNYILLFYVKKTGSVRKGLNRYVNGSPVYVKKVISRYSELAKLTKYKTYAVN